MKKYLLSLLITWFTFIGFSSASNMTCSWIGTEDWNVFNCSPSYINSQLTDEYDSYDFIYDSSNIEELCIWEDSCTINIYWWFTSDFDIFEDWVPLITCGYPYDEESPLCSDWNISYNDFDWNNILYLKWYFSYGDEEWEETETELMTMNFTYSIYRDPDAPSEPDEPDEPWTWWNEWTWWWTSWWWIIAGGINAFSGITERLWSIFWEFWPYLIYIAIACLWIALLFKALKSLLWFTKNKAKKSIWWREGMKERRRRRRQQRRKSYTQEQKQFDYSHKYYYKNWWKWKRYRRSFKTSWAYSKK